MKREIAVIFSNQGDIYLRQAAYAQAKVCFQRTLDIAKNIGDRPTQAIALINLGLVAARHGNLPEAEQWYRRALASVQDTDEHFYFSLFHSYLATALIEQGKLDEAIPQLLQALKISRAYHIVPCTGFALLTLGQWRLARAFANEVPNDRLSQKRLLLRARKTIQYALTFPGLETDITIYGQLLLARIALLLEETQRAQTQASKALEESLASDLIWLQANAYCLQAQAFMTLGQHDAAETLFNRALAIFAETNMRLEQARTLQVYASSLLTHSAGATACAQAQAHLREALQTFQDCQAALDQHSVECLLASLNEGPKSVMSRG